MSEAVIDPVQGADPVKPTDRVVDAQEKALVADWNKRIEAALKRVDKEFKKFTENRKLMAGKQGTDEQKKMRANLHYANMASMLPQVYAKDPEFSVQPTLGVGPDNQEATRKFAATSEIVLKECLVKEANLKKHAKKQLRSTYTTSIGWLKCSWQEDRKKDPLILNQIKDTQDNINRLEMLLKELDDPSAAASHELQVAQLKQTMAGLETQQEVTIARGLALDFLMSEDVVIIDESVRSITDYPRASAIAHRVWMTVDQYKMRFGCEPKKAKSFCETNGVMGDAAGNLDATLVCVWEIWSQDDNRIYYLCTGEEGFCENPKSPEWTGKRWFPFFLCAFNEIDGAFYPMSDVELTAQLVEEYNKNREDFVRDRKGCLPVNIARKGGSLKDEDLNNIKNREGSDLIMVEGVPGTKLSDEIFVGQLGNLQAQNYDTTPSRQDMEQMLGGGDAARGSVLKAKTATEAEIVSQGLRGRSAERQDVIEDMLNELGPYALEICLRKMSVEEVRLIAGKDAEWPSMSIDGIFNLVKVEVRGGSTGKPDRLQEQDRWTKLLPVIKEAVEQVAKLREAGQDQMANVVIELTRETLRRFDERIDIEQFLPPPATGDDDPAVLKQQLVTMQQQLKMAMDAAKEANDKLQKGYVEAATQIATSSNPAISAAAFSSALQQVTGEGIQPASTGLNAAPVMPTEQQPPAAPLVSLEPSQLQ